MEKENKFKGMVFILIMALVTIASFVFEQKIYGENSIFNQSISNNAVIDTVYNKIPCIIKSIQIITIAWIVNKIVYFTLTKALKNSKRGSTITTLLASFIKYCIAIFAILYILAAWGVDIESLVTGMGILALVVGLGAQSLIADIIAGIFFVFEGEFKVGDIVVIDGWKGTITEIGIRTTKIVSIGNEVKIVNNSQISSVINLSEKLSAVACEIDIDYNEDLEKVENIIKDNLEDIKSRIPKIATMITYVGVTALGVNYMSLLIVADCNQVNYDEVKMSLLRELKLMIDRNGIKKPKPTMYFSQDIEK